MHYAYFILLGLIFAIIFWGSSSPTESVSFCDSLFLVVSAFTGSGLNPINLSQLTTGQQVILTIMMILGSPVLISLFTIWFRTHIFEKRFEDIVAMERGRKLKATGTVVSMAGAMFGLPVMSSFRATKRRDTDGSRRHWQRAEADAFELSNPVGASRGRDRELPREPEHLNPIQEGQKLENVTSTSGRQLSPVSHTTRRRPATRDSGRSGGNVEGFDFRTFVKANKKSIGRNGQFFDLTEEKREYLGGVEYRALKVLFVIVGVYFVLWQLLGAIALGAWISVHGTSVSAVNSQNPWWSGVFLAISSFNSAGMTLLDAGIAAFEDDAFVLTIVTILALAGSSIFPAFLRATVYFCSYVLKIMVDEDYYDVWKEAFDFILKYPRRLYMMMFPAKANWIFVAIFSVFSVLGWVLLLVLSIGNSVLDDFSVGKQIGIGLFQSLTISAPGFAVFSVSSLYFDVQVFWVIVMYISAYPEIIVMRNSNVYEERSLGIYAGDDSDSESSDSSDSESVLNKPMIPLHGPLLSTPPTNGTHGAPRTSVSGRSQAETVFSTASVRSIKKLATVGRRGTAFVGKQIQKRMNNFQGVGVAAKPRLKRATEIRFDDPAPALAQEGQVSLVSQHLRGQLSHDIWFIALALFIITLIETSHSIEDPTSYSVFNFLFEIVSGYTNIGLSVGVSGQSYSFCGGWYTGSKLIMVLMMLRGRHRGLPVALDHAVKLPGWDNVEKQEEDAEIRRSLGRSRVSLEA
ncbi:High-affinity potassium transport protein [Cytospora mali]|uniref:High-affinity potassium transport protein n=1 Tax=Cytospora mali TaxID=578113 RepID=A0A194V4R2_CYTMA|nr:High-affinity potassium transport protein [Valsa mali var. pyri (nom. inval.)]